MSRLNKDINIIKQILHFCESSTPELDFGVKDYLEGKFEGWMKRKGYNIQDDKFHDWFMNGYWGSEIKPKEDKYLEVYNYGARLAKGNKSENFSRDFVSNAKISKSFHSPVAKAIIMRMNELDRLITNSKLDGNKYGGYIKESNVLNMLYQKLVKAGLADRTK